MRSKGVPVAFRVSPETSEQLRRLAEMSGRTMSQEGRIALTAYVNGGWREVKRELDVIWAEFEREHDG